MSEAMDAVLDRPPADPVPLAPQPPIPLAAAPATAVACAPPLLSVRQLSIGHGSTVLQRALDFEAHAGEVLVVAGASGCGKSTLLRHLVGLQPPLAGQVLYSGVDYAQADDAEQARIKRGFGVMFQGGALWSSMTVGDNVLLPLRMFSSLSAAQARSVARFKLALVGLADSFERMPSELSGGMKKRAAIARALALDPPLLFLDEPSAGLDPMASARLDELIGHLRDAGTGIVMVSHELASIFAVADRLLFLDVASQTMSALGPPQRLLHNGPEAVRAFLSRGQSGSASERTQPGTGT